MRAVFLSILLILTATLAPAQVRLDQVLRGDALSRAEIRFLQAALAHSGHYDGLLDGTWGGGSLAAFKAAAKDRYGTTSATLRDAARMAQEFDQIVQSQKWQVARVESANVSFQYPAATVQQIRTGSDEMFSDSGGALQIRSLPTSRNDAQLMHDWVAANTASRKPDYSLVRENRIVSATRMINGLSVYVRSDRRKDGFATTSIQWIPDRQQTAQLVVASLRLGKQSPLALTEGGLLQRAIARLGAGGGTPTPKPDAGPRPGPGALAGTGFYINNTDIVTAARLAELCTGGMTLATGEELGVVRTARKNGLVLLTSTRRSDHWLEIGAPDVPDLNDALTAWRHSVQGAGTRLAKVNGTVVSLTETEDRTLRLVVNVPPRRDGLGAPVFDRANRLVGVVVARSDSPGAGVPRHLGFVAPAVRFANLLERNNILFARPDRNADRAVAPNSAAIVPVFCK